MGATAPTTGLGRFNDHDGPDAPTDSLETELNDTPGLTAEQRAAIIAGGQQAIVKGVNSARERLTGGFKDLRTTAELQQQIADTYAEKKFDELDEELGLADRLGEDSTAYAAIEGTFVKVVSAAVTLIIGIYVFAQISSTMPTPQNNQLANATSTVKSTTGSAFTLGAVAIIVLVASLILMLVGGFGMGNGGRGRGR